MADQSPLLLCRNGRVTAVSSSRHKCYTKRGMQHNGITFYLVAVVWVVYICF